jgi:coenzyme F420-reducing hydrogenase beta subunit
MAKNNMKNELLLADLTELISHGFCVGCGICVGLCADKTINMVWNKYGALEPEDGIRTCSNFQTNTRVCPFADGLINGISNPTEDEIAENFFKSKKINLNRNRYIGLFSHCYVGYSENYRKSSTSGGLATWILTHLLNTKRIDYAFCVHPSEKKDKLFEYRLCSNGDEILTGSKSKYYPVHLADVIKHILGHEAKYAIVSLPCFIKGLRYAQELNSDLKKRVTFIVGLFCGGLKTSYFTEYFAAKIGVGKDKIINPQYRIKNEGDTSKNYSFGWINPDNIRKNRVIRVKNLGDLWGPGYFQLKACDYCDDITSELADISAGDAWIQPYIEDWKGNNVIITRSNLAETIIIEGINKGEIKLEEISTVQVEKSISGNIRHRRIGLSYRLRINSGAPIPKKRVLPKKTPNLIHSMVFKQRMKLRQRSHDLWLDQRKIEGSWLFEKGIMMDRYILKFWQFLDKILRNFQRIS